MRIGLASTDFERDYGTLPLRDIFERLQSFGCDCMQLSFSSIQECGYQAEGNYDIPPQLPEGIIPLIRRYSGEYGITVSAINGTYNTAHPDETVRREGLRRFALAAEAAQEIGCPIVTLCSGSRCREDMWTPHPDNDSPDAIRDMRESMVDLAGIAERENLILAIEPEASNILNTPEKAREILKLSPRLKMIMDAANLFHEGEAKRQNARPILEHAFSVFGPDIALAHGKDILEGPGIRFCAGGEGIVDFPRMKALLDACGFHGDMIVHGVYDESKMPAVCTYMREIFNN